jgi:hypothetical protein
MMYERLPKRLGRAFCTSPRQLGYTGLFVGNLRLDLVAPSGELLHMHFPDSGAVEEEVVSVFAGHTT